MQRAAFTLTEIVAFVVLMGVVGRRAVPWLLTRVAKAGSRELFTLAVLAVSLGVAVGAASIGMSNPSEDGEARRSRSKAIEEAMSLAIKKCYAAGITDPVKIREAMMAAREKVKNGGA